MRAPLAFSPVGIVMIVSGAPPSGRIRRMRFDSVSRMSSVSQLTLDGTSIGARGVTGPPPIAMRFNCRSKPI